MEFNIADKKTLYLNYVRDLAGTGNFYALIKSIENSIPNVRLMHLIIILYNIVF